MDAVDFPVIGFRAWYFDPRNDALRSVVQDWHWQPGLNEAKCLRTIHLHRDPAPSAQCECGLYAFHDHLRAMRYDADDGVVGIVRGWGQLQVHKDGWRAQHAEILAIVAPDSIKGQARARKASERYRVPLLHHSSLPGVALEFGRVVPEELRPNTSIYAGARGMSRNEELASLAYVLAPIAVGAYVLTVGAGLLYRLLRRGER